jgi:hypothetical protein
VQIRAKAFRERARKFCVSLRLAALIDLLARIRNQQVVGSTPTGGSRKTDKIT